MKPTFFLIAFWFISFGLLGQIEKGNFLIGGTASISNSNETTDYNAVYSFSPSTNKTTSVGVTPNLSYFVVNRFAVGLQTDYSYLSEKLTQGSRDIESLKGHTLSVGPQARYYFPFGNWAVFPQLSYTWGWTTNNSTEYSSSSNLIEKEKTNVQTLFGGVGLVYFVRKNIGIEAIAGYKQIITSYTNNVETKDTNSQFTLNFGLQFYLNRK